MAQGDMNVPLNHSRGILSRRWAVLSVIALSTWTVASIGFTFLFGFGFHLRAFRWKGWIDLLYYPIVMGITAVLFQFLFRRRLIKKNLAKKTLCSEGLTLKVLAIFNAVFAIFLSILASDSPHLSALAPGIEAWSAWLLVGWLWFLAALSYWVGDIQMRKGATESPKEPIS